MTKKADPNSTDKGSKPGIIYIGEDKGFWDGFIRDFSKSYKQIQFKNTIFFEKSSTKMQNLIVKILAERPKAIFFDLSKYSEEVLHIARVIIRSNAIIKPSLFGLVDITTDEKYLKTGILAGIPIIHIKTSETESIVYDLVCNCFHDSLEEHGFAIAKMDDQISAFYPTKVGTISSTGLHLESNFPITKGETYLLRTAWLENKMLISPLVLAKEQSETNLFYHYEYAQDVNFVFIPMVSDVITDSDSLSNDEYNQKSKELQEKGSESQGKIQKWVEENLEYSAPKSIKVLVVDKSHAFYDNQPKTDEYPFVLRCQPYLKFPKKELTKFKPHLIIFNMEDVPQEELEANADISYTYNEKRTLQYIVKSIKSMENYTPYIIVFNNMGLDTKNLQEVLMYPQIISYKESINPSLVPKMAELLKSKLNIETTSTNTFVLNKSLRQSYAEYEFPIQIKACSETDIYFSTDLELHKGTLLRVNAPTPMFITVAEPPKNPKAQTEYYALINGIGEAEMMDLRKFVNSVFFRSLEEQKAAEKAEIAKLKEDAIKKKKQEEEEALAAKKAEEERIKNEKAEKTQIAAEKAKMAAKDKESAELEQKLDSSLEKDKKEDS